MKCQSLFPEKNKNISKCQLLKFFPSMLNLNLKSSLILNRLIIQDELTYLP